MSAKLTGIRRQDLQASLELRQTIDHIGKYGMEEKKEASFEIREDNGSQASSPVRGESGRIPQQGNYHNDYSPRYKERYNIYDKAREHMKQVKKSQV